MTNINNLTFLTNNVNEYLKSKLLCFFKKHTQLLRTWLNDFNEPVFFSHGTSNSYSVLNAYLGKTSFVLSKQKTNKNV